jgi:hypothetical protein
MGIEGNKIKHLDAEELTSLARQYYSARFPNPQRIGCPPQGRIVKLVEHQQIPDQALREHLFECSECFGEYRQALAQNRRSAPGENEWRYRRFWILRISGASTVLVLSLLIIWLWPKPEPKVVKETAPGSSLHAPGQGAQADNRAGAVTNQTDAIRIAETPMSPGPLGPAINDLAMARPSKSSRGVRTFDVDLENYQNFRQSPNEKSADVSEDQSGRGDANPHEAPAVETSGAQNSISLPSTHASVILRLPETGTRGKYNVSFIDAFGKTLWSTSAYSHDGSKLRVTFNLRRISPKKCRLRLARNGEAPAYYDVIISGK